MLFSPDTRVPARPATNGPEALFTSAFLASGTLTADRSAPQIFTEPKLPTGFPDIVAVYLRDTELTLTPHRNALTPEHLRLLHHICCVKRTSLDGMRIDLRWQDKMLRRCIDDLAEADLLYVRRHRVVARGLRSIFAARKIVAIEAKIDNWWRAIRQASCNTWFASHSYVLIPKNRNLESIKEEAVKLGVGVMVFNGEQTEVAVEARRHPLPASYGSWLLNEWTLRRVFSDSAA